MVKKATPPAPKAVPVAAVAPAAVPVVAKAAAPAPVVAKAAAPAPVVAVPIAAKVAVPTPVAKAAVKCQFCQQNDSTKEHKMFVLKQSKYVTYKICDSCLAAKNAEN